MPALLLATCLSRLAGRMFALALVLYALGRFGSPAVAGWLAFAAMAPGLVISPLAGALIDRAGAARAILIDLAASAACILALVLTDWLDGTGLAVLLGLTTLFSLSSPLSAAGIRTLLPRLVPVHALDRANALDTAIHGLVDVIGPALAGALVGWAGARPALLAIALLYAAAALCFVGSRPPERVAPRSGSLVAQALVGLVRVVRQPTLRGLAVSYSLYQVTWGILIVAVPVFAARSFAAGKADFYAGLLWAAAGIAGGFGALLAGRQRTLGRERRVMALGMAVTALASWPIAAEFGLGGLVAGLMLIGAMAGPVDVGLLTLRQRRADPAELGRVLSVSMSLNLAGLPLGSLLAGLLTGWSVSAGFVAAAVTSALAAGAVALIPRQDCGCLRPGQSRPG